MKTLPLAAALALTTGCTGKTDAGDSAGDSGAVVLDPVPPQGNLLIEEVFYAGSPPTSGIDRYYGDQFIELRNISEAPVQLGGLIIGDAPGISGRINQGDQPGGRFIADPDYVFLSSVWKIPGEPDDVLLPPGESIVIAHDGMDHAPYSALDLSQADYETYVEEYGEDLDSPVVENLESVWYTGGYDWLVTVFGPTIIVLSMDVEDLEQTGGDAYPMEAPHSAVVDTMEALMDADSGDYKRLHESLDAGFVHVSGTYTGESVKRKRDADGKLIDTNDSGADFEVGEPAPWE